MFSLMGNNYDCTKHPPLMMVSLTCILVAPTVHMLFHGTYDSPHCITYTLHRMLNGVISFSSNDIGRKNETKNKFVVTRRPVNDNLKDCESLSFGLLFIWGIQRGGTKESKLT